MFKFFKKKGEAKTPDKYEPPVMPPFPKDYEEVVAVLAPYYHEERPLDFFFGMFVIDELEELPDESKSALSTFSDKHPDFFADTNGDWKKFVIEQCHLSDTIETAIWDLWIRNSVNAKENGWTYHPWHYAQNFADNYFADDSKIDVWEGDTLDAAKKRIEEHKNG